MPPEADGLVLMYVCAWCCAWFCDVRVNLSMEFQFARNRPRNRKQHAAMGMAHVGVIDVCARSECEGNIIL